jgi:hypothetical protein
MRYTILFSILLFFIVSCTKDKFASTPSLKFKSVNTPELHPQQLLVFKLSFTDAEGDFNDTTGIFVQQITPNCAASNGNALLPLPPFPSSKNQKGEITVTFGYNAGSNYQNISPQCAPQNDTATFRFALTDAARHTSDTVSSPIVIIYNQ